MPSFRLTKQTSKNVADTTFKTEPKKFLHKCVATYKFDCMGLIRRPVPVFHKRTDGRFIEIKEKRQFQQKRQYKRALIQFRG